MLLSGATFQISEGDRAGLIGRNGAGKTTLTRALAGETQPAEGTIVRTGSVGYLPQDPAAADERQSGLERILSARGLGDAARAMGEATERMGSVSAHERNQAMKRYARAEDEFIAAGGYAAEAGALAVASGLGLDEAQLRRPVGTLSGGQRRRVELARLLFAEHDTLLLDEPTNHLDADSITWLRNFLAAHNGGLVVISHDVDLLSGLVNKVLSLDANRAALDVYNAGWAEAHRQRDAEQRRRKREQVTTEKRADALVAQAERMRAKATKAKAAQSMLKRADRMRSGLEEVHRGDRVAALRFPDPVSCGKVPLSASDLTKSYGSQDVFIGVDLAVDRGSRTVVLGLNGAGKTTLLRLLSGLEPPDSGRVHDGHGLRLGYYAQEHETLDHDASVLDNLMHAAPHLSDSESRGILGSFLFSGDTVFQRTATLSGGEKTRLALACLVVSGANVLLLDEPTNNLDPASRDEVLGALANYPGAVVLVTHDEGAVRALEPERVLLLPDGNEDQWNDDYLDLVTLA